MNEKTLHEVDFMVLEGKKALESFLNLDQKAIDNIVAKVSVAAIDAHGVLAKAAVDETKRGVFEDKANKNLFAVEYVINHMRHLKTVGIISNDEVTGIKEVADPVGVICAITPVTNPTSTTIFKALIALKTRNPIIFAFHPNAQNSSVLAAKLLHDAAVKAGAPKNCIQWIKTPSLDSTNRLMNHEDIATILATGGNSMVKAAYSCGKPALGVGAGNVPAYIEKSANIKQAVNDVVLSKSFDNGMVCASEQAVIIDKEIIYYEEFVNNQKKSNEKIDFCCDYDKIVGTIGVRSRLAGDKIRLANRKISKSVKKLLNEIQIPFEERDNVPILYDDKSIIGVVGISVDERVKIDSSTKKVLQIKLR